MHQDTLIIHKGHLEYLEKAKQLGDKLIVILNTDYQVELKGSVPFMNEKERKQILESIVYVDEVFLSIDKDKSVCKSLEFLKPDIFANGGDRNNNEIPESVICKKYNIEIIDGLGGKIQSSSSLINKSKYLEIGNRPWGTYFVLENEENYKVKRILVNPSGILSLQKHQKRKEIWIIINGEAIVTLGDKIFTLYKGETVNIDFNQLHRLENKTNETLELIEVQIGSYFGEDDIERLEDIYNRK